MKYFTTQDPASEVITIVEAEDIEAAARLLFERKLADAMSRRPADQHDRLVIGIHLARSAVYRAGEGPDAHVEDTRGA